MTPFMTPFWQFWHSFGSFDTVWLYWPVLAVLTGIGGYWLYWPLLAVIWRHFAGYLTLLPVIWRHCRLFDVIAGYLTSFADFCRLFDVICRILPVIWRHLPVFVVIYRYLTSFAGIWPVIGHIGSIWPVIGHIGSIGRIGHYRYSIGHYRYCTGLAGTVLAWQTWPGHLAMSAMPEVQDRAVNSSHRTRRFSQNWRFDPSPCG